MLQIFAYPIVKCDKAVKNGEFQKAKALSKCKKVDKVLQELNSLWFRYFTWDYWILQRNCLQ